MQGVIVVNKERGFTSFDVVAKLRGILKTKKIGHTGTLDPEAEGVLVCCIGKATKLADTFINHHKTYEASLILGKTSDTYDIWGEVLDVNPAGALDEKGNPFVTEEAVRDTILGFKGKQNQIPPMYSAKKVGGKKLYELAREGKDIERKPVPVEIYDIVITDISLPKVSFTVSCSKGTYIRSLCHDIGQRIGCGACMTGLKRIKTGDFSIDMAHSLGEIEAAANKGDLSGILIPIDEVLGYKKVSCKEEFLKYLENGNKLYPSQVFIKDKGEAFFKMDEPLCVYHPDGRFAAVYIYKGDHLVLDKYFLE